MLFQTIEFGILFAVTTAIFYKVCRGYRLHVLATSSLIFYAASGTADFVVLAATIIFSYFLSRHVRAGGDRWPIFVAVGLLFASLGYFKYSEFILTNFDRAFGTSIIETRSSIASTILPLGISFFTFQIVSYFIDLYRGETKHAKSLLEYTVFVTFFAQLIAGPIMRGRTYLPQLANLAGGRWSDVRSGGLLVLTGLFKKVVLADFVIARRIAAGSEFSSYDQPEILVASGLFAFKIYFDFSGYVDIGRGLARILGIQLPQNFRTPYLAESPAEFWRRWHITLSNWARDYIYIPLGGNRRGRYRELTSIVTVMVVIGIWHGAAWTFVLWGLIHGIYIVIHRFVPPLRLQRFIPLPGRYRNDAYTSLGIVITFFLITIAWIPFQTQSLSESFEMYRGLLRFASPGEWMSHAGAMVIIVLLYMFHIGEWWFTERNASAMAVWIRVPKFARGLAYGGILLAVIELGTTIQTFIYFRF